MNRSAEGYRILIQELKLAFDHVAGQYAKNHEMTVRIERGDADEYDWAALGYTIHNFYNALENYFLRIAKFFENSLDERSTWHKDLVDRMTMDVPDVRPRLLSGDARKDIHELRSFRHVFRNIYDAELAPDRVEQVNRLVEPTMERMQTAHRAFTDTMLAIAAELDA